MGNVEAGDRLEIEMSDGTWMAGTVLRVLDDGDRVRIKWDDEEISEEDLDYLRKAK